MMKNILISILLVFTTFSCYSQHETNCVIKEISCYNLLKSKRNSIKERVLISKLYYRKDNQLLKIENVDSLGFINREIFFEYNDEDRCYMQFEKINNIYCDTMLAPFDNEGNMYAIKSVTLLDMDFRKSKFIKIKLNECKEPFEITIYQESLKKIIISKNQYEYEYW